MTENDLDCIDAKELAKAMRVHPKKVYASVRKGEIPGVVPLSRPLRFHRATVLAWLTGQIRVSSPRRHK